MAEDFTFEKRFRQPAAVDGDEIAFGARAGIVQAAGDQFLAGAGFAMDEDVRRAAAEGPDQPANAGHAGRVADQTGVEEVTLVELAAQLADLQHQPSFFQRAAGNIDQLLGGERLLQKIVGTVFHRLHGHRHVAVAGDQDHRQFGV